MIKWIIGLALLLVACAPVKPGCAQERVDANIVTGLDVSSSVDAPLVAAQVAYMVQAMQAPVIQERIMHGSRGKIGFAVYLWSSGCASIIDWRIISSPEDIAAVVVNLQATKDAVYAAQAEDTRGVISHPALTDTSNAMACGLEALRNAPYATHRDVLNIVTNGVDNVGGPDIAPLAVAKDEGVTVNGMITPGGTDKPEDIVKYLETFVKNGPTSFIINIETGEDMVNAWIRKFIGDMS